MKIITILFISLLFIYANLFAQGEGDINNASAVYKKYCQTCHGEKGDGNGPAGKGLKPKPTDFTDKEIMSKISDEELYKAIDSGGKAVGKSSLMPSYGTKFKKKDIDDLISYIRSFAKSMTPP